MREKRNRINRDIVLDFLIHSDGFYFKCKLLSKKIEGLTKSQIGNGLRSLKEEGYVVCYNPSQTWKVTDKLKRLRRKL